LIERPGHRFHRANLAFDLQFLLDRSRAHVATTGLVECPQDKEVAYLGARKAAVLGRFDEVDAPSRVLVI